MFQSDSKLATIELSESLAAITGMSTAYAGLTSNAPKQHYMPGPLTAFAPHMESELLNVNGTLVRHYVVPIKGDGSCLFRALSFLMFNTQRRAKNVRKEVIAHVVQNWQRFAILSHDNRGNNYLSATTYWNDMSMPHTYAGLCELIAAGQIYPYVFEVYRHGKLYTSAGEAGYPVRRLRFSDDLSSGHFDAYVAGVSDTTLELAHQMPMHH